MIRKYRRPNRGRGQTYEVGLAWVWPVALSAKNVLGQIGLFVAIDTVAGWISGAFSSAGAAVASGAEIPEATRVYYMGVLDNWAAAARVKVAPDRLLFVLPVIERAREIMVDQGATHADLSVAIRGVAGMVEDQAALSGTPLEDASIWADDEIEDLGWDWSTFEVLDPPAGAVPAQGPGATLAAAPMGAAGWALLAGVVGLGAVAWWKYGR